MVWGLISLLFEFCGIETKTWVRRLLPWEPLPDKIPHFIFFSPIHSVITLILQLISQPSDTLYIRLQLSYDHSVSLTFAETTMIPFPILPTLSANTAAAFLVIRYHILYKPSMNSKITKQMTCFRWLLMKLAHKMNGNFTVASISRRKSAETRANFRKIKMMVWRG